MSRRLLVTGRYGFVGSALARMLATERDLAGWQLVELSPTFDLLDAAATADLVTRATPDAVLHLAAQSNVPESFRDPERTLSINVVGTLNLLRALTSARFRGTMVYAGTGDVYGGVADSDLPVRESTLPQPRNPYAVSKLAAEALCRQWSYTEGLRIMLARSFNHIGPGQGDQFAVSSFARQITEIRDGRRPGTIEVGDIDVTRDFTDVHDVVRAYFALLERGLPAEVYNVCSGIERSLRSVLELLVSRAGVEVDIRTDRARLRPAEQRRIVGSPAKIKSATGWEATTSIETSLDSMLEHWRQQLGTTR